MPQSQVLDFYFDFISPYAYFAWQRVKALNSDHLTVNLKPVLLAGLLKANGRPAGADISNVRSYVMRDSLRIAQKLQVPFTFPSSHPFNPLSALRATLTPAASEHQTQVIDTLFNLGWQRGLDLSNPDTLEHALNEAQLPGTKILEQSQSQAIKDQLKDHTQAAFELGLFGVPSFMAGSELLWGHDRFDDAMMVLNSKISVDESAFQDLKSRPKSATLNRQATLPEADRQRVMDIVNTAPFVRYLGIELEQMAPGEVTMVLSLKDHHKQQDGFVHAGVMATLGDHAAGTAAGTLMQPPAVPLSVEFKVHLLRPALGDTLICHSKVLKPGRRLHIVESEIYTSNTGQKGKLVSKLMVTIAAVVLNPPQSHS